MYKVRGYKAESGEVVEIRTPYSDYEAEGADKVKIKAAASDVVAADGQTPEDGGGQEEAA
jgi:hypothetical protein